MQDFQPEQTQDYYKSEVKIHSHETYDFSLQVRKN